MSTTDRLAEPAQQPTRGVWLAERIVLGGLILWLGAAAMLVDVERYDGFDSICNARWYLGLTETYVVTRAPLMGLLLVPAEWARGALDLHPLDVRAAHVTSAFLHAIYLIGVYGLLRWASGATPACLIAFVVAVPCFMFVSYAPFVSHDILGGGLFLGMLYAADRCRREPGTRSWLWIVLFGSVAVLLHHRNLVCWLVLIGVNVALAWRAREGPVRVATRLLSAFAVTVAGFWVWSVWVLGSVIPDTTALFRPVKQVMIISGSRGPDYVAPIWVYVRNLPAYGTLTVALIVPGLVMCARGSRMQRTVAWAWICGFGISHLIGLREVRYLLYLTPLSAYLLVPPVAWLLRTTRGRAVVLLLGGIAFVPGFTYSVTSEASRVRQPFYRHSELRDLLGPLDGGHPRHVLVNRLILSSTTPDHSPLAGDRNHRLFHMAIGHVGRLFENVRGVRVIGARGQPVRWPDDTLLIWCSEDMLINSQTWRTGPPLRLRTLRQRLMTSRSVAVHLDRQGRFVTRDGGAVEIQLQDDADGERVLALSGPGLAVFAGHPVALIVEVPDEEGYTRTLPARPVASGRFHITGLDAVPELTADRPMLVHGFEVARRLEYGPGR